MAEGMEMMKEKVEVGKRLVEYNRRKREELEKAQKSEQPATLTKYEGLGATMVAELMIGFWFGTGVILAISMFNSLDYCIEELINRK